MSLLVVVITGPEKECVSSAIPALIDDDTISLSLSLSLSHVRSELPPDVCVCALVCVVCQWSRASRC